jgi:hypothetical protein
MKAGIGLESALSSCLDTDGPFAPAILPALEPDCRSSLIADVGPEAGGLGNLRYLHVQFRATA